MERLNPLNDYLFQKVMGEKGDEEQLLSFLNAVLKRTGRDKLSTLEIRQDKVLPADIIGDKTSILDVRAITNDGTRVNVEVQLRNYGNMDRRSLFYWCREYARGIEAGQDYQTIPNVIAINIVNFEFIPVHDFHTSFHLWEDRQKDCLLTDALEIHFVDMIKYKRYQNKDFENEPLHRWLTFFDKDTPQELLKGVVDMDAAIQKANDKIAFFANDKEALRRYEMREMAVLDYNSGMRSAREEGIQEGVQEGMQKGMQKGMQEQKKIFAIKMLRRKTPLAIIVEDTGLDEAVIQALQAELEQ